MADPEDSHKFNQQLDFPKYSYSIFKEDFAHYTPFSLHFSNESEDRSMYFRLGTTKAKDTNKNELSHQMNLLWRVRQSQAVLVRLRPNNYIKLHYDNGIKIWNQLRYNLYLSLNCKHLSVSNLKGGIHLIGKHFQSDFKLKISHFDKPRLSFYNRSVFNYGIWRFGFVGGLQPKSLHIDGCLLGADINEKISIYGRLQRRQKIVTASLDSVYNINPSTKAGLQVNYDINKKDTNGQLLLQRKFEKIVEMIKVKADKNLVTTWLLKFKTPILGNAVSHWLGFRHPGLKQGALQFGLRTEFT